MKDRLSHKSRARRLGLILVVASTTVALLAGTAEAKKKGGGIFNATNAANLPVPAGSDASAGLATSTISAGKQFKGKRIRDVNVTLQLTGTGGGTGGPLTELGATLSAPNGATTVLFFFSLGPGTAAGPLTLDDESLLNLGSGPQTDPTQLYAPYQGSAQPDGQFFGTSTLSVMDNGPVRGAWTLRILDLADSSADPHTNVLNSWSLRVAAGNPFQTK
jgi:hypothetical protein